MLLVKSVAKPRVNQETQKIGGRMIMLLLHKREFFKIWKRSSNKGDRRWYCEAKKVAKRVVAAAMDQASREAIEKVKINFDGPDLFQIIKWEK